MRQLTSSLLSIPSKLRLYQTLIKPVVNYAAVTWAIPKTTEERLTRFERKVLRKAFGPYRDSNTNNYTKRPKENLERLFQPTICKVLRSRRIEWLGHAWRADNSMINLALMGGVAGRRRRGRPRTRWLDRVLADISEVDPTYTIEDARDRDKWRALVCQSRA